MPYSGLALSKHRQKFKDMLFAYRGNRLKPLSIWFLVRVVKNPKNEKVKQLFQRDPGGLYPYPDLTFGKKRIRIRPWKKTGSSEPETSKISVESCTHFRMFVVCQPPPPPSPRARGLNLLLLQYFCLLTDESWISNVHYLIRMRIRLELTRITTLKKPGSGSDPRKKWNMNPTIFFSI